MAQSQYKAVERCQHPRQGQKDVSEPLYAGFHYPHHAVHISLHDDKTMGKTAPLLPSLHRQQA